MPFIAEGECICNSCGTTTPFHFDVKDFRRVGYEETISGMENLYETEKRNISCSHCMNNMRITVEVREFPPETYHQGDVFSEGCTGEGTVKGFGGEGTITW